MVGDDRMTISSTFPSCHISTWGLNLFLLESWLEVSKLSNVQFIHECRRCRYEWSIHINLFTCARNARESSPRVRTPWGTFTGRKESLPELLGLHRAQEVTTGFLGKTIVGRISVMNLRCVAVVSRCLVRYGSTGRNGRVLGWGDRTVWCQLRIEDRGRYRTARRWRKQV
jgi:hypothetical protein